MPEISRILGFASWKSPSARIEPFYHTAFSTLISIDLARVDCAFQPTRTFETSLFPQCDWFTVHQSANNQPGFIFLGGLTAHALRARHVNRRK
jgi:hypothetical protein